MVVQACSGDARQDCVLRNEKIEERVLLWREQEQILKGLKKGIAED